MAVMNTKNPEVAEPQHTWKLPIEITWKSDACRVIQKLCCVRLHDFKANSWTPLVHAVTLSYPHLSTNSQRSKYSCCSHIMCSDLTKRYANCLGMGILCLLQVKASTHARRGVKLVALHRSRICMQASSRGLPRLPNKLLSQQVGEHR